MPKQEVWYRLEEKHYAPPLNEYEEPVGSGSIEVLYWEFPVLRHTPKGVWLNTWGEERFVRKEAHKRYACPTQEEALESWRARKRRQRTILTAQINDVDRAIEFVDKNVDKLRSCPTSWRIEKGLTTTPECA